MRARRLTSILVLAAVASISSCGRKPEHQATSEPLPIDVLADTGRTQTLHVVPPARVWMTRVSADRGQVPAIEPSPPRIPAGPLPSADPESLTTFETEPVLAVEGDLVPPRLVFSEPLRAPRRLRRETVELDVQVDDRGSVADVQWAGGSRDTALVRAATECASAMRFRPATQGGRPVVVWCRQRFDFGARPGEPAKP